MDESVKSGARLEVSVSFGRFENDALSWEKWSSFSPNKYLEEVGNLSTPGSVAQKKAYFEAHYKKIAARKAQELEQERLENPGPEMSSKEDSAENSNEIDDKFVLSNGERVVEEDLEGARITVLANEGIADVAKDDNDRSSEFDSTSDSNQVEEKEEDGGVDMKCEDLNSTIEEANDELNGNNVDNPELGVRKEAVLVGLESARKDSRHKPQERKKVKEQPIVPKKENSKSNVRNVAQKATPTKNERNIAQKATPTKNERSLSGMKKKVVSPAVKPLPASSTLRYSKPTSISTPKSAPQNSLKKKVTGLSLQKSRNSEVGESKRAPPTALHMSLSLGPTNSFSMNRKSLIMESMGDKDIVKRAFKAFQNRTNGSIADEKPSTIKHVSSTALGPKISSIRTPVKGNEGLKKDAEKRATPRSQIGTRSNPLPSRPHKSTAPVRKNTMAFSPTTSLRSDEKAEKRKEFLKSLEAKSIAREAENTRLSAKTKGSC